MPSSPIDRLPRPLAIVVHDAGAANMIAAWAAAASAPPDMVVVQGPARAIWTQQFGAVGREMDLSEAISGAASILSGTGWASDLEHNARVLAAQRSVPSIAVVDHWVNYPMRFERGGRVQLPDAIWVGDAEAARIARSAFPGTRIEQHANLYLAGQAHAAGPCPANGDALFVLEPARSDWGRPEAGAGEFQALDFLMERRASLRLAPEAPLRLRPHPSDPPGKYDRWLAAHPHAALDTSPDLAAALRPARLVIGLNSAALVIALAAGRAVVCALPPHAPPCVLPHAGIARLAAL